MAADSVECDYASGAVTLIRRLEKNHFAALRFKVWLATAFSAFFAVAWIGAIVGPFTGNPFGIAAGVALLSTILPVAMFARRAGLNVASAVLFPFTIPIMGISVFHSMAKTLWRGGVRWRDTFYPLKTLRDGYLKWSPLERLVPADLNSRDSSRQWNDGSADVRIDESRIEESPSHGEPRS